jgi:hypothetical protein
MVPVYQGIEWIQPTATTKKIKPEFVTPLPVNRQGQPTEPTNEQGSHPEHPHLYTISNLISIENPKSGNPTVPNKDFKEKIRVYQ